MKQLLKLVLHLKYGSVTVKIECEIILLLIVVYTMNE